MFAAFLSDIIDLSCVPEPDVDLGIQNRPWQDRPPPVSMEIVGMGAS